MSKITELLNGICGELRNLGINANEFLRPGISAEQIGEVSSVLPFSLPKEVCELYLWRNGSLLEGVTTENRLFPRYIFLSLQRSVSTTKILVSSSAKDESQWSPNWYTLCDDLAGDYYALIATPNDPSCGRIMRVTELVDPFPAFWSFERMLLSILECYRSGAYYLGEDGFLEEDTGLSDELYKRFNNGLSPIFE